MNSTLGPVVPLAMFPQCMVNLVSLGGSFAFTIRFERNDDFAFQKQISTLS